MQEMDKFRKSLDFVLNSKYGEVAGKPNGGYTNSPTDSGGETKWGISKRAHPNLDIANLTPEQAANVYITDYWDKLGCDAIPFPYCTAVFDSGVNCGVYRARDWLRRSESVEDFLNLRKDHYLSLHNKTYEKGWLNRLGDLKKFIEINKAP